MKKFLSLEEMEDINNILLTASKNKQYANNWTVSIPKDLDFWNKPRNEIDKSNVFINDLFSAYRPDKLSAYKKIFDFAHQKNIDLFSIFNEVRVYDKSRGFSRYPEYLDLINYVYQKNYFQPGHDFSIYFNQFQKPTKTNISAQVKLLDSLDNSEKSFEIYCKLFDSYLTVVPYPDVSEQENIKKLFENFKNQDFFNHKSELHQKFYPSLIEVKQISDLQEDDYYSKRFCFSADHRVSTLAQNIENSLNYIYNNVFQNLKDKDIIADFNAFPEQGYFYLYVFTQNSDQLKLIGKTVNSFHNEIQSFLQNNTASEDYYIKLFDTIFLAEKLASKEKSVDNSLESPESPTKKKKI